ALVRGRIDRDPARGSVEDAVRGGGEGDRGGGSLDTYQVDDSLEQLNRVVSSQTTPHHDAFPWSSTEGISHDRDNVVAAVQPQQAGFDPHVVQRELREPRFYRGGDGPRIPRTRDPVRVESDDQDPR